MNEMNAANSCQREGAKNVIYDAILDVHWLFQPKGEHNSYIGVPNLRVTWCCDRGSQSRSGAPSITSIPSVLAYTKTEWIVVYSDLLNPCERTEASKA